MFGFGKKKGLSLGLDINTEYVSLTQLEKTKKGVEVVRFAKLAMPDNAIREGIIVDPDAVGAVIRELVESSGAKTIKPRPTVNVVAPGQSVIIRLLPVPTGMPDDELADVVRQEAINHVPFPMEEANLDWAIMPSSERLDPDGVQRVDVILAAIQKSIVDSYWHVIQLGGLGIGTIGITSLAAIKALAMAGYFQEEEKLTLSVNIRHDGTDISLVKRGMPLFSRSVVLGLDTLVESVSRSLDIPIEEARALVPQVPLLGTSATDPRISQSAQIARTVFGDITDEVGRSIEFYRSQVGDVHVDSILVSGIGALVPTCDKFLQSRLSINTAVADTFKDLADSHLIEESERSAHIMSMGMVVDPTWCPIPTVDIDLNKEGPSTALVEGLGGMDVLQPIETPWFIPATSVGGGIALIVILTWAFFSQYDLPKKQQQVEKISTEIENTNRQLKKLPELTAERTILKHKKELLEKIVKHGDPWASILHILSENTPDGVQIKKLLLSPHSLKIEGNAVDFTKISHFAINLDGSKVVLEPVIQSCARESTDQRIVDFVIVAGLDPDAIIAANLAADATAGGAPQVVGKSQVLYFWAANPTCKQMAPIMQDVEKHFNDRIDFVSINIDDPASKAQVAKYDIKSVPTLYFLSPKGDVIDHMVGFKDATTLVSTLNKVSQVALNSTTK